MQLIFEKPNEKFWVLTISSLALEKVPKRGYEKGLTQQAVQVFKFLKYSTHDYTFFMKSAILVEKTRKFITIMIFWFNWYTKLKRRRYDKHKTKKNWQLYDISPRLIDLFGFWVAKSFYTELLSLLERTWNFRFVIFKK